MSGHVPHEFTSISVSAYEAASLSALLQERSADGWTVVSIVPAGTSVVAYLARPAGGSVAATAVATTATAVTPEPAAVTPASSTGAGWALQPDSASSSTTPSSSAAAATPAAATPAATTSTSTSAAAPAGWYADPSGRFELRYWDGGRWTEHVSRGGTQYTDPPVA